MKRIAATLVLVVASSMAFALPSPKDIETAVNAGQLSRAETMLNEVVREKPNSARAHYELGEVLARLGRNPEARQALLEAQRLDPALKFARDREHFQDLLNKIPAAAPTLSASPAGKLTQMAPAQLPVAPAFPWTYVLLGGGGLVVAWLLFRRKASSLPAQGIPMGLAPAGSVAGVGGAGPGAGPGPGYSTGNSTGYSPGYGVPPQRPGMGMGGAVLGGVAGLAAGYGLAKVLGHESNAASNQAGDNASGLIPIDSGTSPEYGNFDAGAGDSWDDADSSSSDDSNW